VIRNDSTLDAAGSVGVNLTDTAVIDSNVIAASVSVSASSGSVSGSLALSVSLAENTISGSSRALIDNSEVITTGALSDVTVSALAQNQINAVSAAAAVSVAAGSSFGISLAGAGALARNITTNSVDALISDSNLADGNPSRVEAGGALTVSAVNTSLITARLVAASISVAASGGTGAVAVGVAVTLAENEISGTTLATIADSETMAGGDVSVIATDGGIRDIDSGAWNSGANALVVDGARRFADLNEPDPDVPVWSSGSNSLAISGGGTVTLDGSELVDPAADTITFGDQVNLSGAANYWSTGTNALTPNTGLSLALDGSVVLDAVADTLTFTSEHGIADGDIVTYDSDLVTDTSGLVSGTRYRVAVVDEFTVELQTGHAFADGDIVTYDTNLVSDESGLVDNANYQVVVVDEFSIRLKDYAVLDGSTSVDAFNDHITFTSAHLFQDGDILTYSSDLLNDTSGLADGGRYRVTVINDTTIQLGDSRIIDSLSISAAVSVAVASTGAVGVAAAGAVAQNAIEGGYEASILDSDVDAAGDVSVIAQDSSAILAKLFSAG